MKLCMCMAPSEDLIITDRLFGAPKSNLRIVFVHWLVNKGKLMGCFG